MLEKQLATSVDGDFGDRELGNLSAAQKAAVEQMRAVEANELKRMETRKVRLGGDLFADDWDNRMT